VASPGIWKWLLGISAVIALAAGAGVAYLTRSSLTAAAQAQEEEDRAEARPSRALRVEVVRPSKGAMDRITVQPGTVQAYEAAQLFAEVPGYLKDQTVDIGDRVTRGQVLATIDVPELETQVVRYAAMLEQARAKLKVANAHVASARAELDVVKSNVTKFEAAAASAKSMRTLREKQLRRHRELLASRSIDERLVDEKEEQADAAIEAERAARAAILTAKAQVTADAAKVDQALADVTDADAAIKVADAELARAQVLVKFATIVSPYDGVVTQRNYFRGDFVKAATEGGSPLPMFMVERTDKMRVVVQIPDRDVPYADPGDPATVEIDALPGRKFEAKISRIGNSEDAQTRLMRVEIDLPNPQGRIRKGMYGRVTILLEKAGDGLSIPSAALVGKVNEGKAAVYVVRSGKALLVPVRVGIDNGLQMEIVAGLRAEDDVILHPPSGLTDGTEIVTH
jgi:HlyD family secretion protein